MFNFNKTPQNVALDIAISDLLEELKVMEGSNEDYAETADNLVKLMKLKQEVNPAWRPSADAVLAAGGSLLGIILILNFEKLGVVTSKAMSLIGKSVK
jgi:hypothetical protein